MKNFINILLFLTIACGSGEIIAQTRTTRPRTTTTSSRRQPPPKKETISLMDKMNYEIKIGNPGFSNNTFSLTTKLNAGYKLVPWASAGVGFKTGLLYINNPAGIPDRTFIDYGAFVYGRGRITNSIYLQAEYGAQNVALLNGARQKFWAPLVGGGYMQGTGNWSYGVELLYNINQVAQDFNGPIEYWLNFSYKF